jgi:hypothetical protein
MAGFQTTVGVQPAPAVEGDWATANPNRMSVLAGAGGLVSGKDGLYIGRFAWISYRGVDSDNAPAVANSYGSGPPAGLVHREVGLGLITTFLAEGGMWIPSGLAVSVFNNCDIWVRNKGGIYAQVGMKAYADVTSGLASFGATASPTTAAGTASVAAGTGSATASITGNIMTVTGTVTGQFYPGATLSGTGVATGTKIAAQLTSTEAGGALAGKGTYSVTIPDQTVASTTISATYGIMTMTVGSATVGDPIAGANVTVGSGVTALGVGANAGKYIVDPTQTAASAAVTVGSTVETPWYACSAGAVNELVKISRLNPFGG